jgi:predicted nucleotide-binding protein (sugar kinase/HSP70/actin superfamily)
MGSEPVYQSDEERLRARVTTLESEKAALEAALLREEKSALEEKLAESRKRLNRIANLADNALQVGPRDLEECWARVKQIATDGGEGK